VKEGQWTQTGNRLRRITYFDYARIFLSSLGIYFDELLGFIKMFLKPIFRLDVHLCRQGL